jgi:hypothetical protein
LRNGTQEKPSRDARKGLIFKILFGELRDFSIRELRFTPAPSTHPSHCQFGQIDHGFGWRLAFANPSLAAI